MKKPKIETFEYVRKNVVLGHGVIVGKQVLLSSDEDGMFETEKAAKEAAKEYINPNP